MVGERFGKWTVLAEAGLKNNHKMYLCRCDCGHEGPKAITLLKQGRTTQCFTCAKKINRMAINFSPKPGAIKALPRARTIDGY